MAIHESHSDVAKAITPLLTQLQQTACQSWIKVSSPPSYLELDDVKFPILRA